MKMKLNQYKWILVLWMMCGSATISCAYAYDRSAQSASWGYRPVYTTTNSTEEAYTLSSDVYPTYEFQSTSPYSSVVGKSVRRSGKDGGVIGEWPSGDPEDDPIGVLPDKLPIGEPFILLALALLYILGIAIRRSIVKK